MGFDGGGASTSSPSSSSSSSSLTHQLQQVCGPTFTAVHEQGWSALDDLVWAQHNVSCAEVNPLLANALYKSLCDDYVREQLALVIFLIMASILFCLAALVGIAFDLAGSSAVVVDGVGVGVGGGPVVKRSVVSATQARSRERNDLDVHDAAGAGAGAGAGVHDQTQDDFHDGVDDNVPRLNSLRAPVSAYERAWRGVGLGSSSRHDPRSDNVATV